MIFVTNDDVMGKNIRYLRQKKGITCKQLAWLAGIRFRDLYCIEEGKQLEIDGEVLKNICEFFHIPVAAVVEKNLKI